MNGERTGKCLRQVEHIRGYLWHRYSITVNQVMIDDDRKKTVKIKISVKVSWFINHWNFVRISKIFSFYSQLYIYKINSRIIFAPVWLGWPLWNICVTNNHGYVPLVVNTSRSFPRSWINTVFVTRLTRRVSLGRHVAPLRHIIFIPKL
jgi:hypothetical protein